MNTIQKLLKENENNKDIQFIWKQWNKENPIERDMYSDWLWELLENNYEWRIKCTLHILKLQYAKWNNKEKIILGNNFLGHSNNYTPYTHLFWILQSNSNRHRCLQSDLEYYSWCHIPSKNNNYKNMDKEFLTCINVCWKFLNDHDFYVEMIFLTDKKVIDLLSRYVHKE